MNQQARTESTDTTLSIVLVVATVGILLLGAFYIWTHRAQPELTTAMPVPIVRPVEPLATAPEPVIDEAAPVETPEPESTPQRPIIPPPASMESSDSQVKLAITDLAPEMAKWMVSDQQLRKWVLAIDLMADGNVPTQYRPLSIPIARFEPEVRGAEPDVQYFMKPESFTRTDLVVTLFTAIDADHFAQYYRAWLPLLEKVYQEQGKKDKFDQRFRMALQHVIDVKPLTVTPALTKRGGVIYVFADSKLEEASDVEKMMWRMGPDNSANVQAYLKQLMQRLPR